MSDSYPFPMYSGVLDPIHYKQINSAIWLFLWCVSSTTKELDVEGTKWGIVLGGKPIQIDELAKRFDVSRSTVKRWVDTLEDYQYIKTVRAPYGLIFQVRNSKKFVSKNEPSLTSDSSNMNYQNSTDGSNVTYLPFKNEPSNKDIIKDIKDVVVEDENAIFQKAQKIEQHFIQRRGKGLMINPTDFNEMKQLVVDGIPLEIIFKAIDLAFAEYKPKFRHDTIKSFKYCVPRCYAEWERTKKVDKSITDAVPHVSVALRQPQQAEAMKNIANETVNQIESLKANATGPSEEMRRKVREMLGTTAQS